MEKRGERGEERGEEGERGEGDGDGLLQVMLY